MAAFLVFSSLSCIPVAAVLRRLGIISYDPVKVAVISTGANSSSTTRMIDMDVELEQGSFGALDNISLDIASIDETTSLNLERLEQGNLVVKFVTGGEDSDDDINLKS